MGAGQPSPSRQVTGDALRRLQTLMDGAKLLLPAICYARARAFDEAILATYIPLKDAKV
ncbi:uncharacterized protein UV8b_03308 [Ustilaginoidea virens]|uniref:Uncharacterized protein n=1 Tax=Ustilaginoidea virens TaxID=1159556 RepID=A0A8E5MGM5_USTVR|nr:uncharacterized protein UV8b_03308 [Ustilaginoidea virens]QUC19067.1 hypothetical protein UV8b_03308 [Ustilaginoidea virens]